MTHRRVIVPEMPSPTAQATFTLPASIAHYLERVLRVAPGEVVEVCNGAGLQWLARFQPQASGESEVVWLEPLPGGAPLFPVYLAQAMPKADKFEYILQKGTELGVSGFLPFFSSRCVVRPKPEKMQKRLQRWEKIVAEAVRQSERTALPVITPPCSLSELVEQLPPGMARLVCWADQVATPLKEWVAQHSAPPQGVIVAVGPEGGFSVEEITYLQTHGFFAVGLGPLILRTETAGPAVAALLQYVFGLLGDAVPERRIADEDKARLSK